MKANNKRTTVTIKARAASDIAADIVQGLQGIESAKAKIGTVYREAAQSLDTITTGFTLIKWNACRSPESTKAAFTAAGVTDSQGAQVQEFRATILDAVKTFNESAAKTVWQNISQWSLGYQGSKPLHPDVKPMKTPKAEKEDAATTATPVRELVLADPQQARKVISELVAGLTANMGLKKKNKISTSAIQDALTALADADTALASMK